MSDGQASQAGNVVSDDEDVSRPAPTPAQPKATVPTPGATARQQPQPRPQQAGFGSGSGSGSSTMAAPAPAAGARARARAPAPAPAPAAAAAATATAALSAVVAAAAAAAAANPSIYPMANIMGSPDIHDVLLGRGGGINNRPGNIRFRELVRQHKVRYIEARKIDKPKVAVDVVKIWRNLTPPGRFLERTKGPGGATLEPPIYHDVGDKKAQLKASQCLRERTPDVVKLVQQKVRKKRSEESKTDILIPVCQVGKVMPPSTDVLRWAYDSDYTNSSYRDVEFRSLITSRAYRIIPLYYVQNCQRRCVQRAASAVAGAGAVGSDGSSNSTNVEYLALLVELRNSYEEEEKEPDINKKRKIAKERGTKLVTTKLYRYSWVRGIPNGRIELTRPMDNENVMIDNIYPQLISLEANTKLPRPLDIYLGY